MKHHIQFNTDNVKYPFDKMSRGDYFDVPQHVRSYSSVTASTSRASARIYGYRFEASSVIVGGIRMTRVTCR